MVYRSFCFDAPDQYRFVLTKAHTHSLSLWNCYGFWVIAGQILLSFAQRRRSWSTCTLIYSSYQVRVLSAKNILSSIPSFSPHQFFSLLFSPSLYLHIYKAKKVAYFCPFPPPSISSNRKYLSSLRRTHKVVLLNSWREPRKNSWIDQNYANFKLQNDGFFYTILWSPHTQ